MRRAPLRAGIAGTGARSAELAAALRGDRRAVLVAVQDPLAAACERFGTEHGAEIRCATFEELLEHVDLVLLASPPPHHAPQACEALARGVHVLGEVPAAVSHEQAQALVAAARGSAALYSMAENYRYYPPNLVVAALARTGKLGELYYGESDHIADVKPVLRFDDGSPTWKQRWLAGRDGHPYPTHSLGPLLDWFDDRVIAVSCAGAGRHTEPEHELQDTTVLLARTARGGLLRLRFDYLSNRPWLPHQYAIQGTEGAYDQGDPARGVHPAVYLHGRSPADTWEPLASLVDRVLPARYAPPPGVEGVIGLPARETYALADTWMVRDFLDAVLDERAPEIDVHRALDMTLPAFGAESSIAQGGAWVQVPNSRFFTAGIGTSSI